jgi:hypothetical protein
MHRTVTTLRFGIALWSGQGAFLQRRRETTTKGDLIMQSTASRGVYTTWGQSQHSHEYADGIVLHSTAGHGGFVLSAARHRELQAKFKFDTFAGGCNYEEDCDAAVVIVAFPQFFSEEQKRRARNQVLSDPKYYGKVAQWVNDN